MKINMAFGKLKQNFSVGDWVKLGNLVSEDLDGLIGRIGGMANTTAECDFYIVIMAQRIPKSDAAALVIIESCLEPYAVQEWAARCGKITSCPNQSSYAF